MLYAISILFFAAMYSIKGGWLGMIPGFNKLREKNKIIDRLLDGKVLSTALVFVFFAIALSFQLGKLIDAGFNFYPNILFTSAALAAAWLIGVAPSMGEENGATGRIGHAWGEYIEAIFPPGHKEAGLPAFGRSYGVKKALQRGVFMGAPMAIVTGLPHFLLFGALVPVLVFATQQIYYMIHRVDSWQYSEPVVGAVVFGIGVGAYLS